MSPRTEDNDDRLRRVKDQIESVFAQRDLPPPIPPSEALDQQIDLSKETVHTVNVLGTVEDLPEPTKDESVEEARKILRWLRNMEFGDRDIEQWLDASAPKVVYAKKQALQKLIRIMAIQIHHARLRDSALKDDPKLENAEDALRAMALTMAEHTLNLMVEHHRRMEEMEELIENMSERALMRQGQSLNRLLDILELGLERATGQEVSELSAGYRLQAMSQEIQTAAYQLNAMEKLEPPSCEESIELARDVLHKMQAMPYRNFTVTEFIENGKPEDKVAFAQQVGEMVSIYRNLMAEAAALNPSILQDHRVKQANEAVGQFAYAVKLMAAKEIPAHEAATQQISADVTRMPEHWGEMHDRTIDRLLKTAEEALEKAMEDLAEEQEQQQEAIELAVEVAAENALHQHDHKKRKKKRKGDSKKSGKGGKKQRRLQADLTADDFALKQGRFADKEVLIAEDSRRGRLGNRDVAIPPSLRGISDLEAIRELGDSLRDIGNQLRSIATTVSNPPATTQVTSPKGRPAPNKT